MEKQKQKLSLTLGDLHPTQHMVPTRVFNTNRVSHFSTTHYRLCLHFKMGRDMSPQNCRFPYGIGSTPWTHPKQHLKQFSHFCSLCPTDGRMDRHTHTHSVRQTQPYSIDSKRINLSTLCVWCSLVITSNFNQSVKTRQTSTVWLSRLAWLNSRNPEFSDDVLSVTITHIHYSTVNIWQLTDDTHNFHVPRMTVCHMFCRMANCNNLEL